MHFRRRLKTGSGELGWLLGRVAGVASEQWSMSRDFREVKECSQRVSEREVLQAEGTARAKPPR